MAFAEWFCHLHPDPAVMENLDSLNGRKCLSGKFGTKFRPVSYLGRQFQLVLHHNQHVCAPALFIGFTTCTARKHSSVRGNCLARRAAEGRASTEDVMCDQQAKEIWRYLRCPSPRWYDSCGPYWGRRTCAYCAAQVRSLHSPYG